MDEAKEDRDLSSVPSPSPNSRFRDTPEPPSPAPREIINLKRQKDEKSPPRNLKDDGHHDGRKEKSPKEEKVSKKDKKKDRDQRFKDIIEEGHPSSERIIIGGEDAMKSIIGSKSRLPHEVLAQFEGKSREVRLTFYLFQFVNELIVLVMHINKEIIFPEKSWSVAY